jgi:hypothetical protein
VCGEIYREIIYNESFKMSSTVPVPVPYCFDGNLRRMKKEHITIPLTAGNPPHPDAAQIA